MKHRFTIIVGILVVCALAAISSARSINVRMPYGAGRKVTLTNSVGQSVSFTYGLTNINATATNFTGYVLSASVYNASGTNVWVFVNSTTGKLATAASLGTAIPIPQGLTYTIEADTQDPVYSIQLQLDSAGATGVVWVAGR